ncbi:MAG: hypothetical protein SH850_30375, partial [Planctomycetaceae bacterium]|nr:hypothetical protein [Planctomycetaceae bacterium]
MAAGGVFVLEQEKVILLSLIGTQHGNLIAVETGSDQSGNRPLCRGNVFKDADPSRFRRVDAPGHDGSSNREDDTKFTLAATTMQNTGLPTMTE